MVKKKMQCPVEIWRAAFELLLYIGYQSLARSAKRRCARNGSREPKSLHLFSL